MQNPLDSISHRLHHPPNGQSFGFYWPPPAPPPPLVCFRPSIGRSQPTGQGPAPPAPLVCFRSSTSHESHFGQGKFDYNLLTTKIFCISSKIFYIRPSKCKIPCILLTPAGLGPAPPLPFVCRRSPANSIPNKGKEKEGKRFK